MSIEVLKVADDLQGESSDSLLWVAAKVLMFLVPFLLLLRVVTAMREIRLSRRSSDHTADHSFAAILLVSHILGCPAANTACLIVCPKERYPYGKSGSLYRVCIALGSNVWVYWAVKSNQRKIACMPHQQH